MNRRFDNEQAGAALRREGAPMGKPGAADKGSVLGHKYNALNTALRGLNPSVPVSALAPEITCDESLEQVEQEMFYLVCQSIVRPLAKPPFHCFK